MNSKIQKALELAFAHGQTDGDHHKTWVIDQMVRALLGSKKNYNAWIKKYRKGDDGPDTYSWDEGIAP